MIVLKKYHLEIAVALVCLLHGPVALSAVVTSTVTATDRNTGCKMVVPKLYATTPQTAEPQPPLKPWGQPVMHWSGNCANKRAEGNGVARMMSGGKVIGVWYGSVTHGILSAGVIEDSYGYEAMIFANGRFSPPSDPAAEGRIIAAAKTAAEDIARGFEKAGNAGSARFYRERAKAIGDMNLGE